MIKFEVYDLVKVITTDCDDEAEGISVGDTFRVLEESEVPYCEPVDSFYDGHLYAFNQGQLELVEDGE